MTTAYTIGRAAEMLGTTPDFLRALGEARLITPLRSEGGHRRYSREDQLEEARRINAEYRRAAKGSTDSSSPPSS